MRTLDNDVYAAVPIFSQHEDLRASGRREKTTKKRKEKIQDSILGIKILFSGKKGGIRGCFMIVI